MGNITHMACGQCKSRNVAARRARHKDFVLNFENSFSGFIPCPDRDANTGTATSVGLHLCYRLETGD